MRAPQQWKPKHLDHSQVLDRSMGHTVNPSSSMISGHTKNSKVLLGEFFLKMFLDSSADVCCAGRYTDGVSAAQSSLHRLWLQMTPPAQDGSSYMLDIFALISVQWEEMKTWRSVLQKVIKPFCTSLFI